MEHYTFRLMTQQEAEEVAYEWHYRGVYSFYNLENDREALELFLEPRHRKNNYYTVSYQGQTIGLFCFEKEKNGVIELGLGIEPSLTGKGFGSQFVEAGIHFCIQKYHPKQITLSVATFNKRAIKTYTKVGFEPIYTYKDTMNNQQVDFLLMQYNVNKRKAI